MNKLKNADIKELTALGIPEKVAERIKSAVKERVQSGETDD
ncbi:MAG: hypothetical protein U5K84_00540 [Alkalibacterium sp.]|nr:hypothetical protein [Alkalibacterium sp.]